MTKRMLIDASHGEETRVVVLDGNRLEDFDVETSTKRHLKGNIYLAKVIRVEPSLQAAFVEYGGNRHGFLAFSEIHPDYYQIPVADRQRLLEMEAEEARREAEEDELELALSDSTRRADVAPAPHIVAPEPPDDQPGVEGWALPATPRLIAPEPVIAGIPDILPDSWALSATPSLVTTPDEADPVTDAGMETGGEIHVRGDADGNAEPWASAGTPSLTQSVPAPLHDDDPDIAVIDDFDEDDIPPETLGGDADPIEDSQPRRPPPRFLRNYKIQEVIRRRQIMLVQVVKEERGNKGAALTTYLSLAGRFSVLMPNSPRGGGISRKITSAADRRRLKEVMTELEIPRGMGLIIRTAGAARPKPEIKRDCEYLLRLWDDIRDHTMRSIAPALIYEEASLIKRSIRDVYSRDIEEILVDGQDGWRSAHDFMRMLMPSHARKVELWQDSGQPLFARYQVEAQLDAMFSPIVQLRSGGYLVINQAEALVAIDVNSGRSTRERNIEETALRTNLEAADEVARQLRLRDLAGLIVIDFIDMESRRHNAMVERRLKEALKNDRARIQVGHISHFGLLEMSRQRLRPSLAEASFIACPHCGGTGHVRSTENAAIYVLRGIEDEGSKHRAAEIVVHVATPIALYLLNHKRDRLRAIEQRYGMRVIIAADDGMIAPRFRIERVRVQVAAEAPSVITPDQSYPVSPAEERIAEPPEPDEADDETDDEAEETAGGGDDSEDGDRGRRRRRKRRRGRREDGGVTATEPREERTPEPVEDRHEAAPPAEDEEADAGAEADGTVSQDDEDGGRGRRRGRRGGRRRRREFEGDIAPHALPGAEQPETPTTARYAGPTPANPFGDPTDAIFDIMDQVEQAERPARQPRPPQGGRPGAGRVQIWAYAHSPAMFAPEPATPEPRPVEPAPPTTAESWAVASVPTGPSAEVIRPEAWASAAVPAVASELTAGETPEPVAAAVSPAPEPAPEPEPAPVAANDPGPSGPAVKPIVIGEEAATPTVRKRGWWRR